MPEAAAPEAAAPEAAAPEAAALPATLPSWAPSRDFWGALAS